MNTIGVATVDDIVNLLLKERPSADASEVERHVKSTVEAIRRQQAHEQLLPSMLKERLNMISEAAHHLDGLISDDDDPSARSARQVIESKLGKSDFQAFSKTLEDLASGRGLDAREFSPAHQPDADEYATNVADAARELRALLSENSPYARAMREELGSSAIEAGHTWLQDLATSAEAPHVPTGVQHSAFFAPAEVARYGVKLSTAGRSPETDKLVAVWGAHHLLVELGFPLTGDVDLRRVAELCYEAATAEPHADLSHAVKRFLDELRNWKLID